jgi:hypothetical protein
MTNPRVLISIDYEPWVGFIKNYLQVSSNTRKEIDAGYTKDTLTEILSVIDGHTLTIFLVGEIANWYPEIPQRVVSAGHELGFHSHVHRLLTHPDALKEDLFLSKDWINRYHVHGYRAPVVNIPQGGYQVLSEAGLTYSSSTYAPTGSIKLTSGVWEVPVSTWAIRNSKPDWWYPRNLSLKLLANGEFPYGSGFFIGLMGDAILFWIEHELRRGRSPVLVIHNYQITPPEKWPEQIKPVLRRHPLEWAFVPSRQKMLRRILNEFPVSTISSWLNETIKENN